MKTQKIVEAVNAGNYEVQIESDCGCCIEWSIEQQWISHNEEKHELTTNKSSKDCCWIGFIVYIGVEPIAASIYGEGFRWLVPVDRTAEGFEDVESELEHAISVNDSLFDFGTVPEHEEKEKEALIDYLATWIADGGQLKIDLEKGFANSYTCILVKPNADPDDISGDWCDKTPEDWADDYLYKGDAATQAYVGFKLIE